MALPQYNVEKLIQNIKRRCTVPTSQLTFTEEDFTLIANDELQTVVVPLMMSTREEFFVDYIEVTSHSDGRIPIPPKAIGSKLRTVCYVQQSTPLLLINLPLLNLDVVAGVGANFINGLTFTGFYLQDDHICLYPNTSVPVGTRIRLYYYRRTLELAAPSQYGRIRSIDPDTNTILLDYVPSSWIPGTELNAVKSEPSFSITSEGFTVVASSAPSIIVSSVEGLSVGDYISELGYSAIPQVPVEAHAYLAQLTAAKCLESLGDFEGAAKAEKKAEDLSKGLLVMTEQRVDGSPKKVISPNGGVRIASSLRGIRRGSWGY